MACPRRQYQENATLSGNSFEFIVVLNYDELGKNVNSWTESTSGTKKNYYFFPDRNLDGIDLTITLLELQSKSIKSIKITLEFYANSRFEITGRFDENLSQLIHH